MSDEKNNTPPQISMPQGQATPVGGLSLTVHEMQVIGWMLNAVRQNFIGELQMGIADKERADWLSEGVRVADKFLYATQQVAAPNQAPEQPLTRPTG